MSAVDLMRHAQAERFYDYFELQIGFAELMARRAGLTLSEALARYTNLRQRFGLSEEHPAWLGYLDQAAAEGSTASRARLAQAVYRAFPEPALPAGQTGFGCFACEPLPAEGVVRLHFHNRDPQGPLARERMAARRAEMREMFAFLQRTAPEVRVVRGASWLHNLEAYRRLYPPAYAASRRLPDEPMRLSGSSTWGQFLDREGRVKPHLKAQFLSGLDALDLERPWRSFPIRALAVEAPIETFFDFLGLGPAPSA